MPESAAQVPDSHAHILESKALLHLALVLKDGTPQVSPVWFDTEGDLIRINSARGRLKDKVMRSRPAVAAAIVDPEDPFCWLGIKGTVVEITEEGAEAHIDALARKYLGTETYQNRQPGQVRVLYKIRPEKVFTMAPPPALSNEAS
ncbi:MAG: PPOX class F420-dependent oxidoreductase [Nitrospinota bacterium]|jgi:PPOX class probable F420-dependent enzyme|nr:PPOX class F420-dependent enzyme [Nitrospinota bacterium]MDP6277576.1 PPOX class F420-dependent oxidoreductase [Nitrospinota bacterium]MDP6366133.1 PPOX class F420-dependent oxidoreductase [Nitrospinota bacterium]MDP7168238.1 PPOX class F420-dependent oxidoreductase [Nitrospinota bacterium]MDP7370328.1 PPOX class F420-dependent oxidoreductase [Nitrospinota bacterium]